MKNTFALILIAACLALGACQKKSSNQPQGGVDGSGGDLPTFEESTISEYLNTKHKYYVRDVVHRLFLIKENSPKDFGFDEHIEVAQRFLGDDQEALQKEIDKVTYTLVRGRCPAANSEHGGKDASYSNGNICFSYEAFKNFSGKTLIPKLLSMTFHELAHMRGFNESEAESWQMDFDNGNTLSKTILWANDEYHQNFETLKTIDLSVGLAMSAILEHRDDSNASPCRFLTAAETVSFDFTMHLQFVPGYIAEFVKERVLIPLMRTAQGCESRSKKETAKALVPVLKDMITANRMLEYYGSPFCQGLLCLYYYPLSAPEKLQQYEALSSQIEENNKPEIVKLDHIQCSLKSVADNQDIPLLVKKDADGTQHISAKKDSRYMDLDDVSFFVVRDVYDFAVKALVSHFGRVIPLNGKDFASNSLYLTGHFFTKEQKEISVRFATFIDPKLFANGYLGYNSQWHMIPSSPLVVNSYEFRCLLGY